MRPRPPRPRHASVIQPLFGVADDEPGARRIKLYLQFEDGHGPAPLAIAERLLGARLHGRLPDGPPLHLLGIDLGDRGVTGAKLYFLNARLDLAEAPARIGPAPLLAALFENHRRELRDVLTIHRLEAPDDPAVSRPVEIDFALADSGLAWTDVRPRLFALRRHQVGAARAHQVRRPGGGCVRRARQHGLARRRRRATADPANGRGGGACGCH